MMDEKEMQRLWKEAEDTWREVDPSTLVDISTLSIPDNLKGRARMEEFIRQVKNPYLYRCGDLVIHSVFSDIDVTLEDRLSQYERMEGKDFFS